MPHADDARLHDTLAGMGIDAWLASHVRIATTPAPDGDVPRGNLSIGYLAADGSRRETSIVSTPTLDEAWDIVADRDRIGPLLALAVAAMPETRRPVVPEWIERHPDAASTRSALERARALADDAARGREASRGRTDADPDAPF